MTELLIRAFEGGDLAALQAIRQAAFAPVFGSFRALLGETIAGVALAGAEAEQAALLDRLCASDSDQQVAVALVDDGPVGFVAYGIDPTSRVGEIGLNAVHPDHAGRGIGSALYRHALAGMRALGATLATVGTGGDASHAAARRAYAKVGFGPAIPSLTLYREL
jgi:GNAT superfamily N-acetyltransferase